MQNIPAIASAAMPPPPWRFAVMGAGGLGGWFGGQMARAGLDVTFIARGRHLEAIRRNGLQVRSPDGDFLLKSPRVSDDPAQVGSFDLILFSVKAYDAALAAEQMRPMLGDRTVILPVLNGIDHIQVLAGAFGAGRVLGGLAACGAHVVAPGVIQHISLNSITFGELSGGLSERCTQIEAVLKPSGIQLKTVPDVPRMLWLKLANLAGLGVCSAARASYFVVRATPQTLALVRDASSEAVRLARARGIPLDERQPEDLVNTLRSAARDFKPSMLVDLEIGRRLEVEWLNGAVSRMGRESGVPTPVNDFITACLKPWAKGAGT